MDYKILDCTLRDGGYVNNWNFGYKNIKKILNNLVAANIDIIECGFLNDEKQHSLNTSLFNTVYEVKSILPENKRNSKFVCMINQGEYNVEKLPDSNETELDGIRVAFHKEDFERALETCKIVIEKGYQLFIQPMVTNSYNDSEFLEMISIINKLNPYALYIVDSFGSMVESDVLRLHKLADKHLNQNIMLGFHAHNNLQLAFSNAKLFTEIKSNRLKLIDTSVLGMGRGAGNLNTEMFIDYLNVMNNKRYKISPILQIIDEVIYKIYKTNYWGYSIPYYFSAKYNCHPNYATFLSKKRELNINDINNILSSIPNERKTTFDSVYIDSLYNQYNKKRSISFHKYIL